MDVQEKLGLGQRTAIAGPGAREPQANGVPGQRIFP